jgi:hypothetical protein
MRYIDAARIVREDIKTFGESLSEKFSEEGRARPGFVPMEAKIGHFLMQAMSRVTNAIYIGLLPFLGVLVAVLFAFWIMMESWQMIKGDNDYWDLALRIVKKTAFIAAWLWILNHDPAGLFMWIMAPVITIARNLSDLILSSTTDVVALGAGLPDTCAAIENFVAERGGALVITADAATELLCMPTRAAGFFYSAVVAGLGWMRDGLGHSAAEFLLGLVFVGVFIYNLFHFALAALGAIMDLFFVIMFLPFTAVYECFGDKDEKDGKDKNDKSKKAMKYEGVFRPMWEEFVGLVKGAKLSLQIKKFVDAMIYFIVLSVMAAISMALLAGANPQDGADAINVLIVGCLVTYLMTQVGAVSEKITGVKESDIIGDVGKDIWETSKKIAKGAAGWIKVYADIIAKGKKSGGAPATPAAPPSPPPAPTP